jgi:hypothetical protein
MMSPHRTPRSRRRHPRAEVPATAIVFANRKPVGPAVVEDLSASGVRLVLGAAVAPGRMVSVLLDLPGKEPFLGLAQVSRHAEVAAGEHRLALSFLGLHRADVERLEGVIARRLAERLPCVEFFDTEDDGRPKELVLTDETPLVRNG